LSARESLKNGGDIQDGVFLIFKFFLSIADQLKFDANEVLRTAVKPSALSKNVQRMESKNMYFNVFLYVKTHVSYIFHTKKKLTHFATKSSEIIISSRTAGSALQKRSLLNKTQRKLKANAKKKNVFLILLIMLILLYRVYTTHK
jgi:hypothetical protein